MKPPAFRMLQTFISLSVFSFVATQICSDVSYTIINNPRRSVKATYDDSLDVAFCDNGIDEGIWFRFSSYSGDAIVEREANDPVPMMACGTESPIYIRGLGSHPVTDYATITATVCANYAGNPCNWMETIQIHRCPGYYLYMLKSPPGCSIAYCVGDKNVCPRGEYWDGFKCVSYFPSMSGFPIFSGYFVNGSGLSEQIYFKCEVQYSRQPEDDNARFRVTFLFDGDSLEYVGLDANYHPERLESTILTSASDLVVVLSEFHLRGRLGREISCQVESYWDDYTEVSPSMRSVATFYATFESTVQSYSVTLTSGSTFNVTFQSTLPLTCHHCIDAIDGSAPCCRYRFRMRNFTASSAQCSMFWEGGNTASVTVYFVPEATRTPRYFALAFEKYNDDVLWVPRRSLWHDYIIPPVPLTVVPQSAPYKKCSSSGDPHFITFDNARFDNLMVGDFYLTRAVNARQYMEIQVRHEICNGGVSCNCGVIVREGNSAFKISVCEAGSWILSTQRQPTVVRLLAQNPADSSTVYVDRTGLIFSVRMPSGLRVEIDLKLPWFNVDVYLPPEYHGRTDSYSMCGNSNGNKNDDLISNLYRFRIPDKSSHFISKPECESVYNPAATRCGCNVTYPICSNTDPTLKDISKPDKPYPGKWTAGKVCPEPQVYSAAALALDDSSNSENDFILDDDILFPPYTYDPDFGVNVSFTWPTPTDKSEQEVEQHCVNMLQSSPVYADCSAKADLATVIDMCKSDIQIADDWISVSAYASVLEQDCLNKIAASINSSSDTGNSDSEFEALTMVSQKLCPNQCSGHGTCSGGNCTCLAGYIGADCSIDETLPPSISGIIRGGVCDVRKRPCDVISVYGSGVDFSSAVQCRFTDQIRDTHAETEGTFISAIEYICHVPETTTHRRRRSVAARTSALSTRKVSITVDGSVYSNTLDFVLFDSVCMECSNSDTCQQKVDSCLISDECFADQATNPDDSCLQCIPSASRNSWKDITVVENWNVCTRNCDVGVETRNSVCSNKIVKKEVEFCEVQNCTENPEQKTQGFGITLSSPDLKVLLLDPVGSLVPFSDALNRYCWTNTAVCCSSVGIPTSTSGVTYTSPDLLTYASGYPVVDSTGASLKIIAKIDLAQFGAQCSQTQNQGSNIVYADEKLIYDAVNSEKSKIEQALSITITSVWSGNSPSSAQRSSTSDGIIYNLIGFWVFIILVKSGLA